MRNMLPFSAGSRSSKQQFNKHKRDDDDNDEIVDNNATDNKSLQEINEHESISLHSYALDSRHESTQEGPSSGFVLTQLHGDTNTLMTKKNDTMDVDKEGLTTNVTQTEISGGEEEEGEQTAFLNDDDKEFPEGGLKAWSVVFGSFMGLIPVFGLINSLGAIESYLSNNQLSSVKSSTVSWIFSIYLSISFFSCIFAGGYFDRNGSKTLIGVGSALYCGGLFALADCHKLWQFILALSVLCGLGTGILMTPLVSVNATWFNKKRGLATSIATAGGSVGGIFMPPMLRKLYAEVGFQWAIRILGFICLGCLILSLIFCVERQKPISKPLGSIGKILKWYLNSALNLRYFLEPKFLFTAIGMSLVETSLTTTLTFIASYSLSVGNDVTTSYNIIMASNAIGILGRYIPGYLADRWVGRFNIMIITNSICAILNLIIWLPAGKHVAALWVYIILFGFFSGSVLSMTPVCIGQISRVDDFGKRYATAYLLQALIVIPAIPIGGAIISNGSLKEYNNFIIYVSIIMAAGAMCFAVTRYLCVGPKMVKF